MQYNDKKKRFFDIFIAFYYYYLVICSPQSESALWLPVYTSSLNCSDATHCKWTKGTLIIKYPSIRLVYFYKTDKCRYGKKRMNIKYLTQMF